MSYGDLHAIPNYSNPAFPPDESFLPIAHLHPKFCVINGYVHETLTKAAEGSVFVCNHCGKARPL